jgi:toxin HigB-1
MIRSFRCPETKAIHEGFGSRKFRGIEEQARKRLRWLDAATSLTDVGAIRGNRFRINDRWRIGFTWRDGNAHEVYPSGEPIFRILS